LLAKALLDTIASGSNAAVHSQEGKLWLVFAGMLLACGAVYLGVWHQGLMSPAVGLAPELYATALAAIFLGLRSRHGSARERLYWKLWAAGCLLWLVSDVVDIVPWPATLERRTDFAVLAFSFVPKVVMQAALVLQPEVAEGELRDPVVRFEAGLLVLWWLFLYLLIVIPWNYVISDFSQYWASFVLLHELQNGSTVIWLTVLAWFSRGSWRRFYSHLAGAFALLALTIGPMYNNLDARRWPAAMIFEALVAASFLWMAAVATVALEPPAVDKLSPAKVAALGTGSWLAPVTAFGVPLLAAWAQIFSRAPEPVRRFRLDVSFAAVIVGTYLVYKRQDAADRQREGLVRKLEASVQDLRQLQGRFAEAEKLASLGQLAAGAAHEINNPVAAMLGYSELVCSDASAGEHSRELARKIADQARRIRSLVHNVLSLAQQAPREQQPVDVADLARSAVDLRRLGGAPLKAKLRFSAGASPVEVRGDPDKLLQVFYGLLAALSESINEGDVEVTTQVKRLGDRAIIEFIRHPTGDSAPCGKETVYDAERAAKGLGLSLSVCHALIQEHGGTIVPENSSGGGRSFRVELPALPGTNLADTVPATAKLY
jgi:signal transduction histidine kinase